MAILPGLWEPRPCLHCKKNIQQGDKKYFSKQAGMRSWYHWECFIEACKQVNQQGQAEIENAYAETLVYGEHNLYDVFNAET